ncbi:MAG: chaperonin GroEL, partial [Candidatus Pacebacteria bacterium]|nr:chaperonin GroEL [Candidatus Paceibacterota bacterium]
VTLENAELDVLGKATRVVSTKDVTTIVGGKGKKGDIESRIEQLKTQLSKTDSGFDKDKLKERIAKLSGGVAVLRVGAPTETEMKYLKLKIEDAINATKAAIAEGVVAGGGSSLAHTASKISGKKLEGEEQIGYDIVVRALTAPLKYIAINAGKDDGSVIVDRVANGGELSGYDALSDKIVSDMFKAGIIDPVKVERAAVENAASAASILLTTEVAVSQEPKEEKEAPQMPGMM